MKSLNNYPNLKKELKEGKTLPASWYTDPEIFNLEKKNIFKDSWHYVGKSHELEKTGDFITKNINDIPVVVIKDKDNKLKAFVNVCKHRGAEILLEEKGHCKTLKCHYHAWAWDFKGELIGAPHSGKEKNFCKKDFPLTSLHLETLGPFIFISTSKNPVPWKDILGQLPDFLGETGVDISKLQYKGRLVYNMKCNWKIVVENFLECYHCPFTHPSFANLIDTNNYKTYTYDYISHQKGALKKSSIEKAKGGDEKLFDASENCRDGIYNFVWPNFMVNIYPGPGNASTNHIIPVDENNTIAIYEFFLDESVSSREGKKIVNLVDEVQKEDVIICESVHRGLKSGDYDQGRLILSKENGIEHFQNLVFDHVSKR
jgi:choline monooxygenase